jgi:threonine/homoserine/homoserine lactone efflux protein
MHTWLIILHGFLIGMLISVPTGPVGFLCLRRALLHTKRASFSSAFGSIGADLIFGLSVFSV